MPPAPSLSPDDQQSLLRWMAAAVGAALLWLLGMGARKATPVLVDTAVEAAVRRRFVLELAQGAETRDAVQRIDAATLRLELQQAATQETVDRLETAVGRLTETVLEDLRARAAAPVRTDYTLTTVPARDVKA